MLSFNKKNKTKKIFIFMLVVVTTFFALLFMPSHARYYGDSSGSLAISGVASMSQLLLNNKIIELSDYAESKIIHESGISYSSTTYDAGYRYEGPDVDNYIWFNCKDVDSNGISYGTGGFNYEGFCEKWRIVGTFSGMSLGFTGTESTKYYTKIIRDDVLSTTYAYDTSIVSGETCNTTLNPSCSDSDHFEYSTLNDYLNGDYYNSLSASAKKMIKPVYWYASSGLDISQNSHYYYGEAMKSNYKIPVSLNVGLFSLWDYLFSASHNSTTPCHTISIEEFYGTTYKCYNESWIFDSLSEWLLKYGGGLRYGLIVDSDGVVETDMVTTAYNIKPVVHLDDKVIIISGNGDINSPYVVGNTKITTFNSREYTYEYTGSYQVFTAEKDGYYFIDAYGAQGGSGMTNGANTYRGGYGAHTSGMMYLEEGEKFYIYVGGAGGNAKDQKAGGAGGYNGGATGGTDSNYSSGGGNEPGGGSGGATDIRYFGSTNPTVDDLVWNSALGLNSRIMVAAGGAGGGYSNVGGDGGTLTGTASHSGTVVPNQTSGNDFGVGMTGNSATDGSGGGGGGYYGGGTGASGFGGGGSSFVSGYTGCVAIASSTDTANPRTARTGSSGTICTDDSAATDSTCSIHYSGKTFTNPVMEAGVRTGHGLVKIIYYGDSSTTRNEYHIFKANRAGYYFIEAYGAQGGTGMVDGVSEFDGGAGAYTSGYLYLNKDEQIYIYVGTRGQSAMDVSDGGPGGYNGGGNGGTDSNFSLSGGNEAGGGGGGATDIRYFSSTPSAANLIWNSDLGLNSRIMVAGGGGGGAYDSVGGYAGALNGVAILNATSVATQVSGNAFGIGQNGTAANGGTGGGGGGYYGGYTSADSGDPGNGGNSYISGYNGAVAIASSSDTANPRTARNDSNGAVCTIGTASADSVCSEHYSGKVFDASVMLSNRNSNGDGVAYITYVGTSLPVSENLGWCRDFTYVNNTIYDFSAPFSGYYKVELWGAQGGNANGKIGGYGGYTVGATYLDVGEIIYFVVGGQGGYVTSNGKSAAGGYNGGGSTQIAGHSGTHYSGAGGGATHAATVTGILRDLSGYIGTSSGETYISDKIIAVAGGGGGGAYNTSTNYGTGGHAGGYTGNNGYSNGGEGYGTGGSQTAAGKTNADTQAAGGFGYGGATGRSGSVYYGGGGGGGWYGGGGASPARYSGGGGGSSYIAGSKLIDYSYISRRMYCYSCSTSTTELIYTISVSCVSSEPLEFCTKSGNGHAKITYLG